MSKSLQNRGLHLTSEAERLWFVNAHTELYGASDEASFASGTPVSQVAGRFPLWQYERLLGSAMPPASCRYESHTARNAHECFALYINTSSNHSLARIDCSEQLSSRIICTRPKRSSATHTKVESGKSLASDAAGTNTTRKSYETPPRWPITSLSVHNLSSPNATVEYRVLLDLVDVDKCPTPSWYCARRRCAASGGELAALEDARDFREVMDHVKELLSAKVALNGSSNRAPLVNASVLYLDVHRLLYSTAIADEQASVAEAAENDEQRAENEKAGTWFWRAGAAFTMKPLLSKCDRDNEKTSASAGPKSRCSEEDTQRLCGAVRLTRNAHCEELLVKFESVQCNSAPPQALGAIALCSRVLTPHPTSRIASYLLHPSLERRDLSAAGFAFLAVVLALMLVYTFVAFAFAFFLRGNRDREPSEHTYSRAHRRHEDEDRASTSRHVYASLAGIGGSVNSGTMGSGGHPAPYPIPLAPMGNSAATAPFDNRGLDDRGLVDRPPI